MARNRLKDQEPSSRPSLPPCRVCGDQAAGYHYGVNTCEACKGFFHRSIRRYKEYTCRANRISGYCEYKPGKRKSCQFCRYQRCLLAGMSREAIKTGRYTYTKRINDTREIKRLRGLQHHLHLDFPQPESPTSFKSKTSTEYSISEWSGHELFDQNFVEVDSATREEFQRLLRSPHNNNSSVYLPDSSALCSSKSVQCEMHITPTSYTFNNSQYYNNKATGRYFLPLSMEDIKVSSEIDLSAPVSLSGAYITANSRFVKQHSDIFKYSDNKEFSENRNCQIKYNKLINVNYDRKQQRKYAIDKPGKINKITNVKPVTWRQARNVHDHSESQQQSYLTPVLPEKDYFNPMLPKTDDFNPVLPETDDFNPVLPETDDSTSCSANSLTNCTSTTDLTNSSEEESTYQELSTRVCEREKLLDPDFDLFPDISSHLDLQSSPRPTYFLNYNLDAQVWSPIRQSASPRMSCATSTSQSLELSPGGTLTAADSPSLNSASSSSNHPFDNTYLENPALNSAPYSGVKDVPQINISELYKDKVAVIAALMASYKVSLSDYSHMPKEEMFAQQKAHYETCQLKKQTFGDLGFLPEQEYDEIYSVTGIDVDNRRTVIRKFLNRMEKDVRDLVQFAKSIPGFSYLDINLQIELVKLARAECCMLSHYRTVNVELGIMLGLTGEHWACYSELGTDEVQSIIAEYVLYSDKLQKMAPTQEEEMLLKAIVVVSTDGDTTVKSPLAEAIRWQLVMCLLHILERNREQPSLFLARYILALTQSRTVAVSMKDFLRKMKLRKYSSIEQNPLLWEICSWIVLEKRDDDDCPEINTEH